MAPPRPSHPRPPMYLPASSRLLGAGQFAGSFGITWGQLSGVPTTLAGFGITDAYTQDEVDTALDLKADLGSANTFTAAQTVSAAVLGIKGTAGTDRILAFQTGDLRRWIIHVQTTAESGSNAGSNLSISRYTDAGGFLGTAVQINRATGDVSLSGWLSLGGTITAQGSVGASTFFSLTGAAASNRDFYFRTAGSNRWVVRANSAAEGGSNAGSDFVIASKNDFGFDLANSLTITRSSSLATFAGNVRTNGAFFVSANQVVGAQGSAITDSTVDLTSVSTQLNALLAACRTHGLIAT